MSEPMRTDDELVEAELAAALVALEEQPLSPALAARLIAQGQAQVSPVVDIASRRRSNWPMWGGWAAAAAVAIWAVSGRGTTAANDVGPAALRASLLTAATPVGWDRATDPTGQGAEGDVVWSDSTQTGVMRFRGLAANDPSTEQYQLWIFDASRDERYPVDGGVFNVSADSGDVLVRIRPSVPVTKATLFVVTVERPGGVVVSDRSRIALLAKRSS